MIPAAKNIGGGLWFHYFLYLFHPIFGELSIIRVNFLIKVYDQILFSVVTMLFPGEINTKWWIGNNQIYRFFCHFCHPRFTILKKDLIHLYRGIKRIFIS